MNAQELAYANPMGDDQQLRSLCEELNSPLPVVGKLHVQLEEEFLETVGEARVVFQPEYCELLLEDDGQDMVLFGSDVDGHEIVFPIEVDGQDIVLDE